MIQQQHQDNLKMETNINGLIKVKVFWKGHANFPLDLTLMSKHVGDFFSNIVAFSQCFNFTEFKEKNDDIFEIFFVSEKA